MEQIAIIQIKESGESKWVNIPVIKVVNKARFTTNATHSKSNDDFYNIVAHRGSNPNGYYNEFIPRKSWTPFIKCEPTEATMIKTNEYSKECVHIGGNKYMMFERVKLSDNEITGLNYIKHVDDIGKFGATVFEIGSHARGVEYLKAVSREVFWDMFNTTV